jgi:predicted nucleic acid-binding Zn ribbon protein
VAVVVETARYIADDPGDRDARIEVAAQKHEDEHFCAVCGKPYAHGCNTNVCSEVCELEEEARQAAAAARATVGDLTEEVDTDPMNVRSYDRR